DLFDDRTSGTSNVLTANGYAVMRRSVNLEIGHPGESGMKGVTAAANKLIEMGVADADRLGVSGTSYGGAVARARDTEAVGVGDTHLDQLVGRGGDALHPRLAGVTDLEVDRPPHHRVAVRGEDVARAAGAIVEQV